ncbi:zinc finger protein [Macleaya cordata]|uniref:Zinc finger protein n=1 Tax=Macleaya cordata TaxID=56857 RepID=A0A200PSI2_MACCD|nr:zinc finger protein [Macleaya cordata]
MVEPVNHQVGKLLAEFNKLRPTSFGGSSDPNAAENWLLDIDSMGRSAPFQIRSYIEAVSKALSIEREDEDIQATRGQVGRTRQFPQQFQVRQDPNKRQVVPTSSGQLSYRPVRQQWQANNQFVPRGVQPPPVRPQGQVQQPGQANSSQIKCFNCNEMGNMKRQCPKLPRQMGFLAPQTQGTLYTIVTEDTPVEEMQREDALLYAITQEDASASDQFIF